MLMLFFPLLFGSPVFAECNKKLDVVLVLDVSGSMAENCAGSTKMDCLKDATKKIIDSPEMSDSRVGIYTFESVVTRVADIMPVSGNEALLKGYVDLITPLGVTALGDGLKEGTEYLDANRDPDRQAVIILFTDGLVNSGILNSQALVEGYVYDNWRDGPVKMYTMGTGSNINRMMLERIADYTHGKPYATGVGCDGDCLADLFIDAIVDAKGGFFVSYLFNSCEEPIEKTIKFDACATNVSDYPPGERNITGISVVDSVTDNLSYVAGSGLVKHVNASGTFLYPTEPDDAVVGGVRILTFDTTNITEDSSIIVELGLINNTGEFDDVSGSKNYGAAYYNISGSRYDTRNNVTFLFYCGCPPSPTCDGENIENNADCGQDMSMCDDVLGSKRYGIRDAFGNCSAKPGCYCVEDPWEWIYDADYSREACGCILSDELWDDANGCCEPGDCFVSSDSTWMCDNGVRRQNALFCERVDACGKSWYWNRSAWIERKPDGCECEDSDICDSKQCITGMCLTPRNPNITFTAGPVTTELGSNTQFVIYVKNNIAVKDTVKIYLHTNPEKLSRWVKFENGLNEIEVSLDEYEEKYIPVEIFGGETGGYDIKIYASSKLVPSLYESDEQRIEVVHKDSGLFSSTPGLAWACVFLVAAAGGLLALKMSGE